MVKWRLITAVFLPLVVMANNSENADPRDFWLNTSTRRAKTMIDKCQDSLYNREYEAAIECFDQYIEINPDDPVGYWRKLNTLYLQIKSERARKGENEEPKVEDKVRYAKIIILSDLGIEKTEVKLRKALIAGDDNAINFYLYVQGAIVGLKAFFQFANGFPLSAEENAKNMIELSIISKYPDSPVLAGLIEYGISRRNIIPRMFAKWRGFPANRSHGLKFLAEALHGNYTYFSDDVRFIIFGILTEKGLKDKERKSAEEILGITAGELFANLYARYPRNKGLLVHKDKFASEPEETGKND